jgi:hypothetical protein
MLRYNLTILNKASTPPDGFEGDTQLCGIDTFNPGKEKPMTKTDPRSARRPIFEEVVLKAWSDPAFKTELLADPTAALATLGAIVPAGVTVKILENTENLDYVVLPVRPVGDLSDEKVAAATGFRLENASGGTSLLMPFCKWCPFCLELVVKAWSDPVFKTKLLSDPIAGLVAAGAAIRKGEVVKVVENTENLVHVVLPLQPVGELSDETLEAVSAGTAACWIRTLPNGGL